MKKTGRAIFLAVAAMLCCTFGTAFAADPEPNSEDDFEFFVNDDFTEITITGYKGTREDVVIPESIQDVPVVRIAQGAFRGKNITSLYVPGVKEIGRYAFADCEDLHIVVILSGIVGDESFRGCGWHYNGGYLWLGSNCTIGKNAFAKSCFTDIEFSSYGSCTLSPRAFSGCRNLKSITLPEGLKVIPNDCFSSCGKLTEVHLPSTLKVIGREAFRDCPIPSVDVPEGVVFAGAFAFFSDAITSLSLPKSLKWVQADLSEGDRGKHAFIYGDNIQSVSIPEGLELCVLDYVAGWANEDDPYELSSTAKGIIGGEAISKSIKLQKQLAAAKTTVFRASTYKSIREDEYMKLREELLKAGLSEEETKTFFAENRWDRQ